MSYLGRYDLAHVPPAKDEDLGHGDMSGSGDDRHEVARELAKNLARVTSTGYVRGKIQSLAVVRGGAQPKMLAEDEHDHAHEVFEDEEEEHVTETLSEIRASVLEAAEANAGNPVGDVMAALGSRFAKAAESSANKAGKQREVYAKRAAEARMKGYEGDACGSCGNFTLVRNGTCLKCNTCGGTSGCS